MKVEILTDGLVVDGVSRRRGESAELPVKRALQMAELGHVRFESDAVEVIPSMPIRIDGEVLPAGEAVLVPTARAVRLVLNGKAVPVGAL